MSVNIRRQFQRVAQRFDQTIGRAERSKVLSEEQEDLEKRVELLRIVCQNVSKRVQACLSSPGQPTADNDKKMKKLPKYGFSQSLFESSTQLGQHTHSGLVMQQCGDAQTRLASEILQLENAIEEKVWKPLTDMLEVDIPAIQKLKKQLNVRTLDMDAAKTRLATVQRQAQQPGAAPGIQARVDAARDEVDDAMTKMEQTRDQLAIDMYTFVAKESDLSHMMLELAKAELLYHRNSIEVLERLIPQLEESVEFSVPKPLFGLDLQCHLERSEREIASVLEDCVTALLDYGLEEEGLFRVAGAASKVKKLKAALNADNSRVTLCPEEFDAHVVSTVLKQYLRELPQPLMTFDLYDDWMQSLNEPAEQRLPVLLSIVNKMPKAYRQNLRYLIKFLAKLSEHSDVNKMSPSNISLVIGPNLLWPPGETGPNMMVTGLQSSIVELLVTNADYFFPGNDETDPRSGTTSADVNSNTQPVKSNVMRQPSSGPPLMTKPSLSNSGQPVADGHHIQPLTIPIGTSQEALSESSASSAGSSPNIMKRSSKKTPAPKPPADGSSTATSTNPQHVSLMSPDISASPQSPISPRLTRPSMPPPDRPHPPSEKPPPPPGKVSRQVTPTIDQTDKVLSAVIPDSATGKETGSRLYPTLPLLDSSQPVAQVAERPAEKQHRRQTSDTTSITRPPRPTPPPPPPQATDVGISERHQNLI